MPPRVRTRGFGAHVRRFCFVRIHGCICSQIVHDTGNPVHNPINLVHEAAFPLGQMCRKVS